MRPWFRSLWVASEYMWPKLGMTDMTGFPGRPDLFPIVSQISWISLHNVTMKASAGIGYENGSQQGRGRAIWTLPISPVVQAQTHNYHDLQTSLHSKQSSNQSNSINQTNVHVVMLCEAANPRNLAGHHWHPMLDQSSPHLNVYSHCQELASMVWTVRNLRETVG